MQNDNRKVFLKGIQVGVPIALGYLAVAFTLGIVARNSGITAIQALFASLTVNASAGEYAGFSSIASGAAYIELAAVIFVANSRYLLMSCALSQKIAPDAPLIHRFLLGLYVTDEIFGVSVSFGDRLNPFFTYGVITIAAPCWAAGTFLGVMMGNALPENVVSALSVGLYGMFLAIIIPPTRKNKVLAALIIVSMAASFAFSRIPLFASMSSGVSIIILTIVIAGIAAVLFPVKEERHET